MILLDLHFKNIYGFDDFSMNFTYPRKLSQSLLGNESLPGRERFRYKKAIILMGTNASGKTSLGKALLKIFGAINYANEAFLRDLYMGREPAEFQVDFVSQGYILHRVSGIIDENDVSLRYASSPIEENDSYEMAARKFSEIAADIKDIRKSVGDLHYRFAYPEIESSLKLADIDRTELLKTLKAVIGTLDPTLSDVSIAKDLKDSYVIRRRGEEIIIQEGRLLNRDLLSSGTAEGIDVAVFLASMLSDTGCFYYCDEHFSYIESEIEKRIFGIMAERLKNNQQLIFTTHNTDMLNLNLPKHSFAFLQKEVIDGRYYVSVKYASEYLKRNTDSVKCAMENDMFGSLPDDSPLDALEV